MPALKLESIEVSDTTLDLIEEELGIGTYDLIKELEEVAKEKLNELRREAQVRKNISTKK